MRQYPVSFFATAQVHLFKLRIKNSASLFNSSKHNTFRYYAYFAYLSTLLSCNDFDEQTYLKCSGWARDSAGSFDSTDPKLNKGFKIRRSRFGAQVCNFGF